MKFATVTEVRIDDKVIPQSSDEREKGKVFIVTDLHPVLLGNQETGEYRTVAVTLWEFRENYYSPGHHYYGKEHVSRTILFQIVSSERV